MNESIFIVHIVLVVGFSFWALKMGKTALSAWIALQAVLANLFVIKQISLFGLHVTCSDVFAIGSIFGLNLLREYYGAKTAKKALWSCFFVMVCFVVMAQIHLLYTPSPLDQTHPAFASILASSPRLLLTSLAVFFLVQQIDLKLFGWMREKMGQVPLSIRNAGSVVATQFLDTLLFSLVGLWGLMENLFDIILLSFLIKAAVIACMTPLTHFAKRFVKRETA